jgi:3-oxoadipate enol-lactonase
VRLPLKGRSIAYDLIGPENAPVVCITHSLASDMGMWVEQVPPLLSAGYRVLRIDMRGHGGSDPAGDFYTMEGLGDDVATVLDALGIGRVHYIGLSIGGMLGQAFALNHTAKVVSALWCDTLPCSPAGAAEVWGQRMATVREAGSLAALVEPTMERWFTDAFRPRNPCRWKQIADTIISTTAAGYLGCSQAILTYDFVPRLPSLKLPVLVVCGDGDAGTPPAENQRLAGLVPGGRYEEIADARHFPNVEHPDVFNRIMLNWLQAQRS